MFFNIYAPFFFWDNQIQRTYVLKKPPYFKIRRYIIISIVVWDTEMNYNYSWWSFSFVFVCSLTPKNCVLGWLLSKLCVCRGVRSAHLVMLANQDCQISRNQTHYTLLQIVTCMLSFSNSIHKTLSAEPAVARIGKKFFAFYKTWMFITVLKKHPASGTHECTSFHNYRNLYK
jgi:hypothetical protein